MKKHAKKKKRKADTKAEGQAKRHKTGEEAVAKMEADRKAADGENKQADAETEDKAQADAMGKSEKETNQSESDNSDDDDMKQEDNQDKKERTYSYHRKERGLEYYENAVLIPVLSCKRITPWAAREIQKMRVLVVMGKLRSDKHSFAIQAIMDAASVQLNEASTARTARLYAAIGHDTRPRHGDSSDSETE